MEQLQLKNQLCFPLYTVSRLITKAYTPYLKEMGLTYTQYLVLMVLWENDKLTVNQISKKLLLDTNTVSPLLKRMEKMDLVQRARSLKDERCVTVQLTTKGTELQTKAAPLPEELLKILLTEKIQLSEVLELKEMLNKWITVLSNKNKNSE